MSANFLEATTRKHDPSHRSWALFGLLVRLAQALSFDREFPDETFFMQQLRRRLWHHVLVLDSFFSFDRGSKATIRAGFSHRPLPVNVNDEDIEEYSTAPTVKFHLKRPTDMNFALQLHELYIIGDRLETLHPGIEPHTWQRRLELTEMLNESVGEKYTQHCDPNIPFQRLTIKICSIIQALNLLNCVRSFQRPFPTEGRPPNAAWVLELAVDVLRKTEDLWSDIELRKWSRLPWVQWHPLAIVLGDLCTIHNNPLAEEAWAVVDRFMKQSPNIVADGEKGCLWQPIVRLYRRALSMRNLDIPPENLMGDLDTTLGFQNNASATAGTEASNAYGVMMVDSNSPTYDTNEWPVPSWLMTSDCDQLQGLQYPGVMQSVHATIGEMPWPLE